MSHPAFASTALGPGDELFDALGDATRRRILGCLARGPCSITELSTQLPVSRPAVSKHLAKLSAARLVAFETRGTRHVYFLQRAGFEEAKVHLDTFWDVALARFKMVADSLGPRGDSA